MTFSAFSIFCVQPVICTKVILVIALSLSGTKASRMRENNHSTPRKRLKLQYVFQYGNGELMRQQTEVREDLRCPWCSLLCPTLFGLLKHLRLSHPRFNFIYVVGHFLFFFLSFNIRAFGPVLWHTDVYIRLCCKVSRIFRALLWETVTVRVIG